MGTQKGKPLNGAPVSWDYFNSSKWFKIHLEELKSKIRSKTYVKGE